jgi:hypothetical protein
VKFNGLFDQDVVASFDASLQTSDAGLLLFGALDRRMGLTERFCASMIDERQAGKVEHTLHDIIRQRVYSLAAGYADGNDAFALRRDPMLKMICDRDPVKGPDLASQPTISRFEHSIGGREVVDMGRSFERGQISRFARRFPKATRVTLDLDGTEDKTHGQQTFSFFNGFYDSTCFLPLVAFLSVPGDPEQLLFHARLRPGVGASSRGVIPVIRRAVEQLRQEMPRTRILVRLDGGFASPGLLRVLEELGVDYVLGLPGNRVLLRRSKRLLKGLRKEVKTSGIAARRFGEILYAAKTWDCERRVVVKAEVLPPPKRGGDGKVKTNLRYTVTNLRPSPQHVYEEVYCPRGDSENRIKELKMDLSMDRTSSTSYLANQFRVLMTAAAFALYQELRWELRGTELAHAQTCTLRLRILKISGHMIRSVRRLLIRLPRSCPFAAIWCRLSRRLGAAPA